MGVEVRQDHKGAPWIAVGLKVNTNPNRRVVGLGNGIYYVNTNRPEVKKGQNLVTGETPGVTLSHCKAEYCEEYEKALYASLDEVEQATLTEDEKAVSSELKIKADIARAARRSQPHAKPHTAPAEDAL